MKNSFGIICFAGSKQEYESWKGYECEIVGGSAQLWSSAIYVDDELLDSKEAKKIEALVNARSDRPLNSAGFSLDERVWGLPVRRKK